MNELPRKINKLRDSCKKYDPLQAKAILKSNGLLFKQFKLSKECLSGSNMFSKMGKSEVLHGFSSISSDIKSQVGIYTCSPYTFMVAMEMVFI